MFNSFSWYEFISAAALVAGGYYVISALLLYSPEIVYFVKYGKRSGNGNTASTTVPVNQPEPDLVGPVQLSDSEKQDTYKSKITTDEMRFPPGPDMDEVEEGTEEAEEHHNEALLVGTIADLLQEAKALIQVIAECNGSKADSAPMFHALLARYPQLLGTQYQDAINLFIASACKEQCSFEAHPHEVRSWWTRQQAL
jgi:hypothetical protein